MPIIVVYELVLIFLCGWVSTGYEVPFLTSDDEEVPEIEQLVEEECDESLVCHATDVCEGESEDEEKQTQQAVNYDFVPSERCVENLRIALESKSNTRESKIGKPAKNVLINFFLKNYDHPYADGDQKAALAKQCRLSVKQVSNWLTNTRKRDWTRQLMKRRQRYSPSSKKKSTLS